MTHPIIILLYNQQKQIIPAFPVSSPYRKNALSNFSQHSICKPFGVLYTQCDREQMPPGAIIHKIIYLLIIGFNVGKTIDHPPAVTFVIGGANHGPWQPHGDHGRGSDVLPGCRDLLRLPGLRYLAHRHGAEGGRLRGGRHPVPFLRPGARDGFSLGKVDERYGIDN